MDRADIHKIYLVNALCNVVLQLGMTSYRKETYEGIYTDSRFIEVPLSKKFSYGKTNS